MLRGPGPQSVVVTMRLRPSALDRAVCVRRPTGPRDLRLPSLGNVTEIAIDDDAVAERVQLDDESWVDVTRGWLQGADALYDRLVESVPWQQGRVFRYER